MGMVEMVGSCRKRCSRYCTRSGALGPDTSDDDEVVDEDVDEEEDEEDDQGDVSLIDLFRRRQSGTKMECGGQCDLAYSMVEPLIALMESLLRSILTR